MTSLATDLLSRRLLLVTGKGGVGKTTVSAALGLLAARRGIETVLVELGDEAALPALLGVDTPDGQNGRDPQPLAPHLHWLRLIPRAALSEYLELQLHLRTVVRLVIGNAGFQRLLDAAPGWRELITLGKLWHLATQADGRWQLLIVDAPATGHGLSLLSVPDVVVDTVRLGPLRRQTDAVQELIHDPAQTLVVPVTLLEELPVQETQELIERLAELGIGTGALVANAVERTPELPPLEQLAAALDDIAIPPLPRAAGLLAIASHCQKRAALQQGFAAELERRGTPPWVKLPQLEAGAHDRADLELLVDVLEQAVDDSRSENGA